MKIILSRKGFDSAVGGVASPIFTSGAYSSLPIPEKPFRTHLYRYGDVRIGDESLGPLVRDLTRGKIDPDQRVHLDPDLNADSLPRARGWRPIFGQAGAAETHLQRMGVDAGDLFLFYGWFRAVERVDGRYRYVRGAPDLHVIYGWMQIERRILMSDGVDVPDWAHYHPHIRTAGQLRTDSLYVSTPHLNLPGHALDLPGGGTFPRFRSELVLSATGATRSLWQLPRWFHPQTRGSALTYHSDPRRWSAPDDGTVLLRSAAQGQEFVLDCDVYPEAVVWAAMLLRCAARADSHNDGGNDAC